MHFAGEMLVGDWETGDVYAYDLDTYSDNGNPLVALRACSTIQAGLEELGTMSFILDADMGVGLTEVDRVQVVVLGLACFCSG